MKIINNEIVEHVGIKIKHECIYCDNVIYNESPDDYGWYKNWLGDWVCEACFDSDYHKCQCGTIMRKKYKVCTDCQMNEFNNIIKQIKEN